MERKQALAELEAVKVCRERATFELTMSRLYVPVARAHAPDYKILESGITRYGSTLYIGIAMVFVFSPYIRKLSSYFHFQGILTFNDFIALNV